MRRRLRCLRCGPAPHVEGARLQEAAIEQVLALVHNCTCFVITIAGLPEACGTCKHGNRELLLI